MFQSWKNCVKCKIKYENILYYYIHFYLISTFEIAFYVYYVSQLESEKFNEFLESLLNTYLDNIYIPSNYLNQTEIQDIGNCKNTDYLVQLANYNSALLAKPIYFVYGTSTVFVVLFAYDVYIMTRPILPIITDIEDQRNNLRNNQIEDQKNNLRDRCDSDGSEMNPMVKSTTIIQRVNSYNQILGNLTSYMQVVHYFSYSKFINEFIKTIKFLCIIGIFEYFLFVLVINQYHLTTPKILECYILNKGGL